MEELGLQDYADVFRADRWLNYGIFAFAVPSVGGSMDEKAFWNNVLRKIEPKLSDEDDEQEPPKAASLRRLWHESYIIAMSEMKARVERTDEETPVKIPLVEREARKDRLKRRLPGLDIANNLNPADCTI